MKNFKKIYAFVIACLLLFSSCGENVKDSDSEQKSEAPPVESQTLFVKKVENISDDFILGMDASCVISLMQAGVRYYDHGGKEKNVYKILSENGINYIRVRVWNDPYDKNGNSYGGGSCDIENAVKIGKLATEYGMKLLVDFHYSDFWADPGKQMCPKAWVGMDINEKSNALYDYTKDCLKKLTDAGVNVGMVQIGNETNGAMCGESSDKLGGWKRITDLLSAGSRAVREACPRALVAVHFTNPEKASNYESYGKNLEYYGVDYDVFASSYYPYWHGTLDNLSAVLTDVAEKYGKKVMVAETSYAFSSENTDFFGNTVGDGGDIIKDYPFTVQGQANLVRDVIDTVANKTKNGIGVFYWEGTWISAGGASYEENLALWEKYGCGWASSYAKEYDPDDAGKWYGGCAVENQAFFDKNGRALESLKVFALVKRGNDIEIKPDAIQDTQLIFDLNGSITLPDAVNAVMNDNSKKEIPVEWLNADTDKMKNNGVAKYTVLGKAGGMDAVCYVSMVKYNFLKNWSFEDGEKGWQANAITHFNELKAEEKVSDSVTGAWHYHFWGANENTVEFTLQQEVSGLKTGKYDFSISVMGGDGGDTDIYAYVKINGKILHKAETKITVYGEWHTAEINGFDYTEGDACTVGIYVKCAGPNAWGKIDDAMLNSAKD